MAGVAFQLNVPRELFAQIKKAGNAKAMEQAFRDYLVRARQRAYMKVSGPVLKVRSGNLRAGLYTAVIRQGNTLIGRLGTDVVYGAIHEFGGTTRPHIIVPRHAKALRFVTHGEVVFSTIVHHPGSVIPKRPYLRPSLDEELPQFLNDLLVALAG